jgi:leucyl aminopeptidase
MKLSIHDRGAPRGRTDLLAVLALAGAPPALPEGTTLPEAMLQGFKGDFREHRMTDAALGPVGRVLVIGLGKESELSTERLRRAAALAVQKADAAQVESATLWCDPALEGRVGGARAAGQALAEGASLGGYRFQGYKTKPKKPKLAALALAGSGRDFKAGAERGRVLAQATAFTRDLQNTPANEMRPRDMARKARELARGHERITCRVLDRAAMLGLGMGALTAVARGSAEPPQLIHLVYKPRGRSRGRVALVGKGLTFDSGGISIKPAAKMWDMKYDMSGGAAVLGTFHALRALDVPFEVHGVVPCSENLPDAAAVKPGDVVRAMDGTTIEVLNTDAEGRLILCDALCYVVSRVRPDTIVDLATLTGAVVVALGHEFSGLFATTDRLRDDLRAAGEEVGERLWPLPLMDFHKEQMKGEVADLRNINSPDHGNGATAGAAFLWHFVGDTEWAHLDIAGTAWGGMNRDYVGGGSGSGVGPRLLVQYLSTRA